MIPASAFLIIHLIAYGGTVQSMHAFRYASMIECSAALPQMELNFVNSAGARLAVPMFCTGTKPGWWQ